MKKKFRAFYKPDFETPDGALKFEQEVIDDELMFVYDEDIRYPFFVPFLDEDWVVQQFTGIKDKNGIEIYEGDILKYASCKMQNAAVEWISENDGWDFTGWRLAHIYGQYGPCEVIGNIYETPELLT